VPIGVTPLEVLSDLRASPREGGMPMAEALSMAFLGFPAEVTTPPLNSHPSQRDQLASYSAAILNLRVFRSAEASAFRV